ncbi:MAG: 2-oxo acid dehydrogenase subunit E2, partial [Bdellovibrionales bacterium]|nr:2-oxo acid dehydrogenase subunit E2 [Bdellovibrionales bacterium]
MKVEIKVPAVGESITEATIAEWVKKNGEAVKRDDVLLILETDKASVEVVAEKDGVLEVSAKEGETVQVGAILGAIDTSGVATAIDGPPPAPPAELPPPPPAGLGKDARHAGVAFPPPPAGAASPGGNGKHGSPPSSAPPLSPGVRRMVAEHNLDPNQLGTGSGKGGRLTKEDVTNSLKGSPSSLAPAASPTQAPEPAPERPASPPAPSPGPLPPLPKPKSSGGGDIRRIAMSKLRQTIARRLVEAQQTAAILTTFNEIDMSAVMDLRARYKDSFKEKYGVSLGFMGFFVKAAVEALKAFPQVNSEIDGTDILFKDYINMGIAVSTE